MNKFKKKNSYISDYISDNRISIEGIYKLFNISGNTCK